MVLNKNENVTLNGRANTGGRKRIGLWEARNVGRCQGTALESIFGRRAPKKDASGYGQHRADVTNPVEQEDWVQSPI